MLNTVSTDDAYVNGHVTFVAPRVAGQISRVLVDDNNRVRKGDLLAELDKEPYRVAVSEKQAAVDTAEADLQAAAAAARAIEAQARSQRWNLQRAVEGVDGQVALLHARVAAVDKSKAALVLAQLQFDRARALVASNDVPRDEYDRRQAALMTAEAELAQTLADVSQIRASLGLPAQPEGGGNLDQVPPDLDETFASVLQAQAELIQSAAQLGVVHSFDQGPKAMLEQFEKLGDIDTTFAEFTANAPAVKQAEAKLETAQRDLAQAELDLRYTDIIAEINGVVTRRNVNPGNYVQIGQNLMAIRSTKSGSMPTSRKPSCATCASGSPSIFASTCTATHTPSRAASPASPREPGRRSHCYRPRTPRAISSRWSSGYRCASISLTTTLIRHRCSSAPRSFPTSISTGRRPARMPESSFKCTRRRLRAPARPPAGRAPGNERRGSIVDAPEFLIPRGDKPRGLQPWGRLSWRCSTPLSQARRCANQIAGVLSATVDHGEWG
jgi:multidrug resistance efflux pump